MLNETVTIGDQEVNVSARRADSGYRISITPDDGAMLENLLATCKTWCEGTINEIPNATAHAHLEDNRVVVSVTGGDFAQGKITARVNTLSDILKGQNSVSTFAGGRAPIETPAESGENPATEHALAGNTS